MREELNLIKYGKKIEIIIDRETTKLRFLSNFLSFDNGNLIISKPINMHFNFSYPIGTELECYVYTDNGVLKITTKLLLHANEECILAEPTSIEKVQRRQFVRVDMRIKVVLDLYNGDNKVKTIEGISKNISAKGLNLRLNDDLSQYTKVEAALHFVESQIKTQAHVVKIVPIQYKGRMYYDTSLTLLTISDKEIDFIVKKCFQYQARQRRFMLENQE